MLATLSVSNFQGIYKPCYLSTSGIMHVYLIIWQQYNYIAIYCICSMRASPLCESASFASVGALMCRMWVCACASVHVCVSVYVYVCVSACTCVCLHVCVHVCACVCAAHVCVYMVSHVPYLLLQSCALSITVHSHRSLQCVASLENCNICWMLYNVLSHFCEFTYPT